MWEWAGTECGQESRAGEEGGGARGAVSSRGKERHGRAGRRAGRSGVSTWGRQGKNCPVFRLGWGGSPGLGLGAAEILEASV